MDLKRNIFPPVTFVLVLLLSCTKEPSFPKISQPISLPLYHVGSPHRFVKVTVLERDWYFLIDTGAKECAVTPKAAQEMGLSVYIGGTPIEGIGGQAEADTSVIPELQMGEIKVKRLPVRVLSLSNGDFTEHSEILGGYLGSSFWEKFQVGFDFSGGKLTLSSPGESPLFPGEPLIVPVNRHQDETRVEVSFDAEVLDLELDTGADQTILFRQNTSLRGKPEQMFLGGIGPGANFYVERATAKEVKLGEVVLSDVEVLIVDRQRKKDGLLGADILSQFLVELDPNRASVYLWPRPPVEGAIDLRPPAPPPKPGPAVIIDGW